MAAQASSKCSSLSSGEAACWRRSRLVEARCRVSPEGGSWPSFKPKLDGCISRPIRIPVTSCCTIPEASDSWLSSLYRCDLRRNRSGLGHFIQQIFHPHRMLRYLSGRVTNWWRTISRTTSTFRNSLDLSLERISRSAESNDASPCCTRKFLIPEMNWRTLRSTGTARCSLASRVHCRKCCRLRPNVVDVSRPSCRTKACSFLPAWLLHVLRSASSRGEASSGSILSLKLRVRCRCSFIDACTCPEENDLVEPSPTPSVGQCFAGSISTERRCNT